MKNSFIKCLLLILTLGLIACGGATSPSIPGQTPTGSLPLGELQRSRVVMKSTNLVDVDADIADILLSTSTPTSCHLTGSGDEADGSCITPLNITGYASSIDLGGQNTFGPGRLFGSTSYSISLDRHGELEVSPFNLKEPITMRASSNLEDQESHVTWTVASVFTAVMDVKLEINNEFWTVRFAFVSQQISDEDFITSCVDERYLNEITENSGVLSDGTTTEVYRKGDMMVCITDDADTACEDEDFLWLNLDTDTFVATRPNNPQQHLLADIFEPNCEESNPGYDITLGGYDLIADLETPFELSATLENSCLHTFSYTDPDTNEVTTGNTLDAEFDYDMSDAVFVDAINPGDIDSSSNADIFKQLTLAQFWIRNTFDDPTAVVDNMGLSTSPEITVSQDNSLSCQDESDVDPQYLTGDDCTPDEEIRTDCVYAGCGNGFDELDGTIWSVADNGGCNEYCTVQSCADFGGVTRTVYCAPNCN